jgi:hypothetical protein
MEIVMFDENAPRFNAVGAREFLTDPEAVRLIEGPNRWSY